MIESQTQQDDSGLEATVNTTQGGQENSHLETIQEETAPLFRPQPKLVKRTIIWKQLQHSTQDGTI